MVIDPGEAKILERRARVATDDRQGGRSVDSRLPAHRSSSVAELGGVIDARQISVLDWG